MTLKLLAVVLATTADPLPYDFEFVPLGPAYCIKPLSERAVKALGPAELQLDSGTAARLVADLRRRGLLGDERDAYDGSRVQPQGGQK